MNNYIQTVIIAPMTTKSHSYPPRISITFQGKNGWIVLEQLRTVVQIRLIKKVGAINTRTILKLKQIINEMLVK